MEPVRSGNEAKAPVQLVPDAEQSQTDATEAAAPLVARSGGMKRSLRSLNSSVEVSSLCLAHEISGAVDKVSYGSTSSTVVP